MASNRSNSGAPESAHQAEKENRRSDSTLRPGRVRGRDTGLSAAGQVPGTGAGALLERGGDQAAGRADPGSGVGGDQVGGGQAQGAVGGVDDAEFLQTEQLCRFDAEGDCRCASPEVSLSLREQQP